MTYRMVAILILAVLPVIADDVKIVKVLPHLLDAKGRHSLSPSLFERDAYQAHLRQNPELVSAIRYDVQWKGKSSDAPLTLKLEIRGSKTGIASARAFETIVKPSRFGGTWSALQIDQKTYDEIGQVIAWRASIWSEGEKLAEQLSFLW